MMRKIILILVITVLLVSGCTNDNENVKNSIRDKNNVKKEVPLPDWEPEPQAKPDVSIEHINGYRNIGDSIDIKSTDFGEDYTITVKEAYITDTLEEEETEWNEIAIMDSGAMFTDGKINEGRRIIYIETQVTNNADETLVFDMAQVKVVFEKNGDLLRASTELGYGDQRGEGKSANMVDVESGCSETMKTGLILYEESNEYPLYLEVSGYNDAENYILIPLNDTVKE